MPRQIIPLPASIDFSRNLYKRLRQAREAAGLTRDDVWRIICNGADDFPPYRLGVHTIKRWETEGHQSFNIIMLYRVCRIYGLTIDEAIGMKDEA